jgi:hypothetical protein
MAGNVQLRLARYDGLAIRKTKARQVWSDTMGYWWDKLRLATAWLVLIGSGTLCIDLIEYGSAVLWQRGHAGVRSGTAAMLCSGEIRSVPAAMLSNGSDMGCTER